MLILMASLFLVSAPPSPAPSVAVLGLSAKEGVHQDVAEQLTETLTASLRHTGRFSRVVSASEIQTLVAFETQKQLANCDRESCMAEIAGALGVDYLVTGTLGRIGETWLFNAKLLNAHTALAEGAVSRPIEGENAG